MKKMKKMMIMVSVLALGVTVNAADLVLGMGEVNVTVAEADVSAFGAWLASEHLYTNATVQVERVFAGRTNVVSQMQRVVIPETNDVKLKRILKGQVENTIINGIRRGRVISKPAEAPPVVVVENPND